MYVSVCLLWICLLLGGGTRAGFLGDVVIQIIAIPALLYGLAIMDWRRNIGAVIFCAALALIPLAQLLQLPPQLWILLPGREVLSEAYDIVQQPRPWLPMSMKPEATWLSVLSLLPPIAVLFLTAGLNSRSRIFVARTVVVFALLSVALGLLQLAQGPLSPLRFFAITNPTEAVGFFANRNHFAALLYCAMLFAASLAVSDILNVSGQTWRALLQSRSIMIIAGSLTIIAVIVIAQTMARSRAGLLLSIIGLIAVPALALTYARHGEQSHGQNHAQWATAKAVVATAAFSIVFALQFALYRILERFAVDPLEDARVHFAENTFALAKDYFPFGTGLGTFVPVYALHERPADVTHYFANRAHNDVLEVLLEAGLPAAILMLVFLFWWGLRTLQVWRAQARSTKEVERSLMKAATVALALLAVHSLVDYPLRTSALMAIAAFCCGLLLEPCVDVRAVTQTPHGDADPGSSTSAKGPTTLAADTHQQAGATPPTRRAWTSDKVLPESWRSKD